MAVASLLAATRTAIILNDCGVQRSLDSDPIVAAVLSTKLVAVSTACHVLCQMRHTSPFKLAAKRLDGPIG